MEKVELTIPEFLSLYTGVLLGKDFSTVTDACEKVFGFSPYTLTTIACAEQFKKYINKNNPELSKEIYELGKFKKVENVDVMKQIDEYCNKFKELHGSDKVKVDAMKYEEGYEIEWGDEF